ncbi:MAG TPA: AraC family transcriptional regulator [Rudaea sp.]
MRQWVPGEVLLGSDQLGWDDMSLRSYRYDKSDVSVPPLRDFVIVAFRQGVTRMRRRVDGPWQSERAGPGDVSILTRAEECHWCWDAPIEVIHLYLTKELLNKVSADALDRDIHDVQLQDVLRTDDGLMNRALVAIAEEVQTNNLGGRLYVDAVATQVCVHLLRKYANVSLREPRTMQGLSHMQARMLNDYIETNLDRQLSLEELAAVTHTSSSHFLRQFKTRFGVPPHAYVLKMRIERAQRLLTRTSLPIKDISSQSGFSDQSHMTRVFQRFLKTTPHSYRCVTSG